MRLLASELALFVLLSLMSFIFSLICVLAGTKPESLEKVNLLTVGCHTTYTSLNANVIS